MRCTSEARPTSPRAPMLERFREAKRAEIEALIERSKREGTACFERFPGPRADFTEALRKKKAAGLTAVVAEYKRASPSRGNINLKLEPEDAARFYAESGAAALSVLTEAHYFGGSLEYPRRMSGSGLPLLRKDFVFHPLQVAATAALPVSALLVIVRVLDDARLAEVLEACDLYKLEAVVEVFSENDLQRAQAHGARIVQVNNRDLDTLQTDLDTSRQLVARKRDELWISASGYETRDQIQEMEGRGFDAFLIGSSLMASDSPAAKLSNLIGTPAKPERAQRR